MPGSYFHDTTGIPAPRSATAGGLAEIVSKIATGLPIVRPLVHYEHDHPLRPLMHLDFESAIRIVAKTYRVDPLLDLQEYARLCRSKHIGQSELKECVSDYLSSRLGKHIHETDEIAQLNLGTRFDLHLQMVLTSETTCDQDADTWIESLIDQATHPLSSNDHVTEFRDWLTGCTSGQQSLHATVPDEGLLTYLQGAALGKGLGRWSPSDWEAAMQYARWWYCKRGAQEWKPPFEAHRIRQTISFCVPTVDQSIRRTLVPFLSAFADPGVAKWPLPKRESGLFQCFWHNFGDSNRRLWGSNKQLTDLAQLLIEHRGLGSIASIESSLKALQLSGSEVVSYLEDLVGLVRGWAGLLHHLSISEYPCQEWVRKFALPELVAIMLLLDRVYLAHELESQPGSIRVVDWSNHLHRQQSHTAREREVSTRQTWLFLIAQQLNWSPATLAALRPRDWSTLQHELNGFSRLDRQIIAQNAYEATYHKTVIRSIEHHLATSTNLPARSVNFLLITCAEPTEESIRRHLEQVCPGAVTAGVPGFFNLDIKVKDCNSNHFLPRAPANVRKRHRVSEIALDAPLNFRSLELESQPSLYPNSASVDAKQEDSHAAFTIAEMAEAVGSLLVGAGLDRCLPRLVIVMGHESSSLNNLYEAADNCTYCAKQHVETNVRALVRMANDHRVRAALKLENVDLPTNTVFVGAIHHTCSDQFTFLDLERVPPAYQCELRSAVSALGRAAERNAMERCGRLSNKEQLSGRQALAHCLERQDSGSYARPEYSLSGNALCIVGRRELTRGLDLERRAFLFSYDPTDDDEDLTRLAQLLNTNLPVLFNISFDYWFSKIASDRLGAGHKAELTLTTGMAATTDHHSDLRIGLPIEMVDNHQPLRPLVLLEAPYAKTLRMLAGHSRVSRFFENHYMHLAVIDSGKVTMVSTRRSPTRD